MAHYKQYTILYALLLCTHATVVGYGLPGLALGYTNILDGGPIRPRPGIYWQQWMQYYTTQRFLNNEGKPLGGLPSPRFRDWEIATEFVYQFEKRMGLRGAMPGVVAAIPVVLYSKIEKNGLGIESSGSGFGNLDLGAYLQFPVTELKGRPFYVHRLEFDFSIPVGKNKLPEKQINPSNTFFYCSLDWSATLYLSWKWSISWSLHYVWSAKNEKIDFQAGDAIYCNYSLAYELYPKLYIAAVGYALGQLHNNRSLGVSVPDSKTRVFGTGPGIAYFFSEDIVFLSYLYLENGARNSTEGTNFIARLVMHF
ncbi:MAG TPA: transporter [Candidatus Babeliales bacterium]|jgi:hypothetical protein|nr:transporter [Candidatus Babeliales bacterium]